MARPRLELDWGQVFLQRREEQVAGLGADEAAVHRAHADGAPDLFHRDAREADRPTRQAPVTVPEPQKPIS
jgi:hypothetical protein